MTIKEMIRIHLQNKENGIYKTEKIIEKNLKIHMELKDIEFKKWYKAWTNRFDSSN